MEVKSHIGLVQKLGLGFEHRVGVDSRVEIGSWVMGADLGSGLGLVFMVGSYIMDEKLGSEAVIGFDVISVCLDYINR